MAPRNSRQYWVDAFWADISAQLRRLSVIEPSLYDGLQLTRDGALGYWLVEQLVGDDLTLKPQFIDQTQRQKYKFFGKDRNWITVIVCPLHEGSNIDWKLEWWLRRPGGVAAGSIQTYSTIKPLIESNISFDASGSSHPTSPSEIPACIAQGMKRVFGPGNSGYDYWNCDGEANYAVGGEVEGNISKPSGKGEGNADKTMPYLAAAVRIKQDMSSKRRYREGNDDGAEDQGAAKKINVKGRRQLR